MGSIGSKRTVILAVALAIGALAAVVLYSYLNGVEDKAYSDAERVQVYVVREAIPANTSGQDAVAARAIVPDQVPKEFMPQTALVDPSTITSKFAKTDLVPGQIVVQSMFVDKQEVTSTWRDQLGADEVAVRVQLDQVKGMTGIIQAGDTVTMLVDLDGTELAGAPGAVATGRSIQFLYSNVPVMAIGSAGVSVSGEQTVTPDAGPITFRVPLKAAEKIALAGSKIYLVLEPDGFVPTADDLVPVDWSTVFTGEKTPFKNGVSSKDAETGGTTTTTATAPANG